VILRDFQSDPLGETINTSSAITRESCKWVVVIVFFIETDWARRVI